MKSSHKLDSKKVAIVHNWMWKVRGAEKTLIQMVNVFPNADIFFLFGDEKLIKERFPRTRIHFSILNKIPFISKIYKFTLPFWPLVTEIWDFAKYDVVISSSASTTKGIVTPVSTKHFCYMYTPMRYIWDQQGIYIKSKRKFVRPIFYLINHFLRIWDYYSTFRIDKLISISSFVSGRMRKYYRREPDAIIYPPVDFDYIDKVLTATDSNTRTPDSSEYLLVVSGFEENKGSKEAVEFAISTGENVVLVGEGALKKGLERTTRNYPNVKFLGWLDDAELYTFMKNAKALLFLGIEDFGIVPVESIYLGTPLIALAKGGVVDSVIDGINGIIVESTAKEEVSEALVRVETTQWNRNVMRESVARFSAIRFRTELEQYIKKNV